MIKSIKDVMTGEVEVIPPNSNIREAAEKMKTHNIGMLPVCDADRLTGTLTDRDITIRAVAENRNPEETKVKDIMTHEVIYCYEDESIHDVAKLMQTKQVRRIIVLNRNKRLSGIVSIGDLAIEAREQAGRTLERIAGSTSSEERESNPFWRQGTFAAIGTIVGAAALAGGYRLLNQRLSSHTDEARKDTEAA